MTHDDVAAVEQITSDAFYDLDVRTRPADWPRPEPRSAERSGPWRTRLAHLVTHDQPGCWVAEDGGALIGAVAALRREGLWGLSTYAVRPGLQARGAGARLLEAALGHAAADAPGFICSSHDPRAVRRYRLAGFDLHPAMLMWGKVDRSALPTVPGLRDGSAADVEMLDDIDRASRGAGHGVDHDVMVAQHPLLVVENGSSRGYAYVYDNGGPYLLAATDVRAAEHVLWAALARSEPTEHVDFHHLTAAHGWAVDIGLRAGLELHNRGYLALRAMAPPPAYLPSGHFL